VLFKDGGGVKIVLFKGGGGGNIVPLFNGVGGGSIDPLIELILPKVGGGGKIKFWLLFNCVTFYVLFYTADFNDGLIWIEHISLIKVNFGLSLIGFWIIGIF